MARKREKWIDCNQKAGSLAAGSPGKPNLATRMSRRYPTGESRDMAGNRQNKTGWHRQPV
ncbi:hypothetical protein LHK_01114 [Laribacter hongkongensis HLHK9]|uniref:Uncharacterized protein n=1 Tax=Laribacter hongkongensis (strain HLHK9) TaxID=557598 RepID=C1D6J8_LARHH|nr:hypothetical protein LHK_01114 [Laribacter hongkongensis HLHK9]